LLLQWVEDAFATTADETFGPLSDEKDKPFSENQAIRSLCNVEGIGSKVALQVRDGLSKRKEMLLDLATLVTILDEPKAASGGPLDGMTFCLTGALQKPRKEVQLAIKAAGGKTVGSVSSQLSVLLAGEKAGSKLAKAESLGVQIWSEQQLEAAIGQSTPPPAQASVAAELELEQKLENTKKEKKQPSLFDFK
jgi:DNA ligase (NAD+)